MKITAFVISVFFCLSLHAQDSCEVKMESIKGTYSGGCVKGKADGRGVAKGTDTYEGNFKAGLPQGNGKYTWNNGSYYTGNWKSGVKEGQGELHEKQADGTEKVTKGFWKKGQYKGAHENPYIVYTSSSEIRKTEFSFVKTSTDFGAVKIEVKSSAGVGNSSSSSFNVTPIRMTDFKIMTGTYMSKTSTTLSNSEVTNFQTVQFPFRGTFYFENRMIDFEILEPAMWDIVITIML